MLCKDFIFLSCVPALWDEINNPIESVTGPQFRETGDETFTEETLLFDFISPSDDIPNHLVLLYLNLGIFMAIIGITFIFKQFNILILSVVMVIMGSINIMLQVQ